MPDRTFILNSEDGISFENEGIYVDTLKGFLRLRPTNSSFEYDPYGTLKLTYADLPTWNPLVWDSFFGFHADYILNGGDIRFQLSPDGGTTFLWHDGSDWVLATTALETNSFSEVEKYISEFKEWDVLRPRVFLSPSSTGVSPILFTYSFLIEYRTHEIVDDICRSFKKYLESSIQFIFPLEIKDLSLSDTIEIEYESIGVAGDIEETLKIKEPIFVFNLDEDPKMRNNLFESLDGISIIKLKKETSGHIKILFTSRPDVHIQTDFDVIPLANHPSLTLQILSVNRSHWDGPGNYPCYEKNVSKLISRAREGLRKYEVRTRLRSYATKSADAYMFTGAVRRVIEQTDRIQSLNYDSPMEALWGTVNDSDWVTQNLFSQSYSPTVIWEDWAAQGKPKEVPLVDTPENGGGLHFFLLLNKDS